MESDKLYPGFRATLLAHTCGLLQDLGTDLELDPARFILFLTLPALPATDVALSNLLDDLVGAGTSGVVIDPKAFPKFSKEYARIMESMNGPSRTLDRAIKFYNTRSNWYPTEPEAQPVPGTNPIYTPTRADVIAAIAQNGAVRWAHELDCDALQEIEQVDGLEARQNGLSSLARLVGAGRVRIEVSFDQFAILPITLGSWFYAGFFTMAYSDHSVWSPLAPPAATWDEIFGTDGSLRNYNQEVVVAQGIWIRCIFPAPWAGDQIEALRQGRLSLPWPWNIQGSDVTLSIKVLPDLSVMIELHILPNQVRILGFNVQAVVEMIE